MGLFRKSPPKANPTEFEVLQSQLDALLRRIETAEVDQTHLGARVVALDDIATDLTGGQLDELRRQLAEIQQRTLENRQDADERHAALRAEVDELRSASPIELDRRVATLDERLTEKDADAAETAARLAALDARLTNVSTELANQIAELGGDIDAIAGTPSTASDDDDDERVNGTGGERIDALVAGQTKLASEQARYEIAFREDLAALAEQIRRSSGR